jgi:hypothetical protein
MPPSYLLWPLWAFFGLVLPFLSLILFFPPNKPKWNKLIWNRERKWTRSVHCPYCASYTSVYPKTLTILNWNLSFGSCCDVVFFWSLEKELQDNEWVIRLT